MVDVGIFVGSVYGNAQHVAEQVEEMLAEKGHNVELFIDGTLDNFKQTKSVIFISSTTGQGDLPPNLEFLIMDMKDTMPLMDQKPFAVVGLGDSSYSDSFCGAGKQIFEVLVELQGQPVADLFIVDVMETLEPEAEVLPWIESILPKLIASQ
ncbi:MULTISPECIES: flavodoxin domain-containing protein [Alteromonadaceae]|uniref:flavodoxin domain-containing protein n=1 Tax=Alteromonadaceae TaxID=72275 RepID=UPI001C08A990|nr:MULTISPECIES: flavodoxin domain-containing protein [Aliiglaciecola]MBU2879641.1 flavodoxin domain-containing protein [Aliiglaciecola lipolytica]MDO6710080.1 flavodoxin domain-containing protein [Aliiglaciecola sp. 2_MG-2023]MDO6751228.1 flavodoxin domain-containing protein [Aliiglaciecola sp. 1_MG-2023]